MINVERYIKRAKLPKNRYRGDDQLNLLDLRILTDGNYKNITSDIIEEVKDNFLDEEDDEENDPTFCTTGSGDGIPDDYLEYYFDDPGHSSLVYFTKNTHKNPNRNNHELIAVLSYKYDLLLNAMHIIAFCVNRRKRFHINGHNIINEIKDIMRNSDIKTIILEAVPSSRKFYNNQGFKLDPARRDPDNIPMISHYRVRTNGQEEWSFNSFIPTTKRSAVAVVVDNRGSQTEKSKFTVIHLDNKNKKKDKILIVDSNTSFHPLIRAKSLSIGSRSNSLHRHTKTKTKLRRAHSLGSEQKTKKNRH
jgi:hypothetical protein